MNIRELVPKIATLAKLKGWRVALALTSVLLLVLLIGLYVASRILGTTGQWFGWASVVLRSRAFWVALSISVVAGFVLVFRWAVPRYRERKFLEKPKTDVPAASGESPQEMRAKFVAAVGDIRKLDHLKGVADPLMALPWYLLLGVDGSGKTSLLREASDLFSCLTQPKPAEGPTQSFDFWISKHSVVIDTAARYTNPPDRARDYAEWFRLLHLLKEHRASEPINAVLIAVPIEAIAERAEREIRDDASRLRERIQEIVLQLGVDVPVYLVLTKCDRIDGFSEVVNALPDRFRNEVIGYIDETLSKTGPNDSKARGEPALGRLQHALTSIYERLHLFRLSILDGRFRDEVKQAAFCFPEELARLSKPLLALFETLFRDDPRFHTPPCRGVFFTSARRQGERFSPLRKEFGLDDRLDTREARHAPALITDLFRIILPRDRATAPITAKESWTRWLRRSGWFGGTALVAIIVGALVFTAYLRDKRIVDSVDARKCKPTETSGANAIALAPAVACTEEIEKLVGANDRFPVWQRLGFTRSLALEESMKGEFLPKFRKEVLDPIDLGLEQAFRTGDSPVPLMLLVARRSQFAQSCEGGCPKGSGDGPELPYGLMLAPTTDGGAPPDETAKLRAAYATCIRWAGANATKSCFDLGGDRKRLESWIGQHSDVSLPAIVSWIDRTERRSNLEQYWVRASLEDPATVDAACRGAVWKSQAMPLLEEIQLASPTLLERLRSFLEDRRATCAAQWEALYTAFPSGVGRWSALSDRPELARLLTGDDSPYRKALREAAGDLAPWTSGGGNAEGEGQPAEWLGTFVAFTRSDQGKALDKALGDVASTLGGKDIHASSLKLARAAFDVYREAEGKTAPDSASPILAAWAIAREAAGEPSGPSNALRAMTVERVRQVWKVVLDLAAIELQNRWDEEVLGGSKRPSSAGDVVAWFGPGGRIEQFVQQHAAPFLSKDLRRPEAVLDETFRFAPAFLETLRQVSGTKTTLEPGAGSQRITIVAGPNSPRLKPLKRDNAGIGSSISARCDEKTYKAVSDQADKSRVDVPWTPTGCTELAIAVRLSVAGESVELSRRYQGPDGFLQFLDDFDSGQHAYSLDELAGADRLLGQVSEVNVFARVLTSSEMGPLKEALRTQRVPEAVARPRPLD